MDKERQHSANTIIYEKPYGDSLDRKRIVMSMTYQELYEIANTLLEYHDFILHHDHIIGFDLSSQREKLQEKIHHMCVNAFISIEANYESEGE